jgi:transposase-like protein
MQYSKEEKQQHIDNWRQSGLSQSAYCRENNLKLATFHYWKMQADKALTLNNTAAAFIPAICQRSCRILVILRSVF